MPLPIPESLLLLALWVVVPLAWPWIDVGRWRWLSLLGALGVTGSMLCGPGTVAAGLAAVWLLVALTWTARVALGFLRAPTWTLPAVLRAAAPAHLVVGAVWLVASRGGVEPMGFKEPIVVLTAVHFHFAGFSAALLTSLTLSHLDLGRPGTVGAAALFVGVPALALGFVVGPVMQLAAAGTIVAGLMVLGGVSLTQVRRLQRGRLLVGLSWACTLLAMALAGVYAVGEYTGRWWLHIPDMAWTHGLLNGIGFAVLGFWGWRRARC